MLGEAPDEELLLRSYDLAVRYRSHPHDAVFVAMAVRSGLELRTLDAGQREMYEREKARVAEDPGRGSRPSRRPGK